MGTLTEQVPALDGHCLHKLPTSCRLTATLQCCACQDKRPHAPTYQTYVDGIGMVSRGTRWQRYCWFCKEFWENRTRTQDVEPQSTKVPDFPDQSDFCALWHDYRRGYSIQNPDPASPDHKHTLIPDRPWRDVAPGYLPTWDQPDAVRLAPRPEPAEPVQPHQSLDATLDSLLESESVNAPDPGRAHRRLEERARRQREAAAEIRARNAPPSAEQVQEARNRLSEAELRRRQIASELASVDRELRSSRQRHTQLLQAQATARNMERVFGTREEFLREGTSYVSPLTSMFTRAYDRYRTAEEVRAADRASAANDRLLQDQFMASANGQDFLRDVASQLRQEAEEDEAATQRPQSLDDERIARPPPKTSEEMRVSLACRICLEQVADTATLPCGHLVMCSYCAAIAVPTKDEAQTQPLRRNVACPQCRRQIKKIARIYTA